MIGEILAREMSIEADPRATGATGASKPNVLEGIDAAGVAELAPEAGRAAKAGQPGFPPARGHGDTPGSGRGHARSGNRLALPGTAQTNAVRIHG